jgi:hypothetical protein
MSPFRLGSLRPVVASGLLVILLPVAACSDPDASATPEPVTPSASVSPSASPAATPQPTPTPEPTPRYTNPPDDELAGLFPESVNGVPLVVPSPDEFALTPGDFGTAYGDIGLRFASLATAYVTEPRLTIYAARLDGALVATEDLEPHLATAGRYVGIAGLDAEPWELTDVAGTLAWARPEDNATALGTMIYTWSSGEFVFLLIGTDDTVNRALVESLPGEPAPTPSPTTSPTPGESPTDGTSPSPTGG